MISYSLESGLIPFESFFVLGKVGCLTLLVLGSLVPYQTIADFIEQQAVMILANQVLQIAVLGRQFFCLLVENVLGCCTGGHTLGKRVQLVVDNFFPYPSCVNKTDDIRPKRVIGEEILCSLLFNNMVTKL